MTEARETRDAEGRLARHLQNLGRMYPVLAHDLHAFLNSMVLNLELLQRTASRDELDAEAVARIRRYAALVADEIPPLDRMLKAVVGQMRLTEPPAPRFDLRTLCEELAIVFNAYARHRRIQAKTTLADVPMAVAGDRDVVAHALTSVLLHALDELPQGSVFTMVLEAERKQAVLKLAAEPADGTPWPLVSAMDEPYTSASAVLERQGATVARTTESPQIQITVPLAPLNP